MANRYNYKPRNSASKRNGGKFNWRSVLSLVIVAAVIVAAISLVVSISNKAKTGVESIIADLGFGTTTKNNSNPGGVILPPSTTTATALTATETTTAVCSHTNTTQLNGNTYCSDCGKLLVISAPVISKNDNVISWGAVPAAENYVVCISGGQDIIVNDTSYTFTPTTSGTTSITVKARSAEGVLSSASNSVSITYYQVSVALSGLKNFLPPYNSTFSELILENKNYSLAIVPALQDGVLPEDLTVSVGGVSLTKTTDYTYVLDNSIGGARLTIPANKITDNVSITGSEAPVYTLSVSHSNLPIASVMVNGDSNGTTIPATVKSSDIIEIMFQETSGYTVPSSINVSGITAVIDENDHRIVTLKNANANATVTYNGVVRPLVSPQLSVSNNIISVSSLDPRAEQVKLYIDGVEYTTVSPFFASYLRENGIFANGIDPDHYLSGLSNGQHSCYMIVTATGMSDSQQSNTVNFSRTVTYNLSSSLFNVSYSGIEVNGVTVSDVPASVKADDIITINFTAFKDYNLPSSVIVNSNVVTENTATTTYGNCAADYSTYNGTGTITLTSFTGNSAVSVVAYVNTDSGGGQYN